MAEIKPQQFRDFSDGRIGKVGNFKLPDSAVTTAKNVHFDEIGKVSLRPGITLINSQISDNYPCLGLHYTEIANPQLLSVFSDGTNSDVYYKNGASWTKTLTDDTKDLKTRFCDFLDRVIRVNGTDIAKAWAGTSTWGQFIGTAAKDLNLDDMDSYKCTLIEKFKERVYMAGNSTTPDRLFYSSIPGTTPYITWAPTTDWVDINPNDGTNINALKAYGYDLLVFKDYFLYRYKGLAGVDPVPLINYGTPSQEGLTEGKGGVYFFCSKPVGIFRYDGASQPVEISRPVADFMEAIPTTYFATVNGFTEADGDHICYNIGDVTVGGVSWTNVVVRYTVSSRVWTVYSYPNELRRGVIWNNATNNVCVVGDSDGNVLTYNSGLTDNTAAIEYELITKYYELGLLAENKVINKIAGICEKAQGGLLAFQVDNKLEWHSIGQLKKFLTIFKNTNISGNRIRFKLFGTSKVAPLIFEGFEILSALNKGVID
jgi:hypothetical protein